MSSSLLCTTRECYFTQLSATLNPNEPNFVKTQWITSEDVNVEHLLDVFTAVDASSDSVWRACAHFMQHLYWHKNRLVVLKPKIEELPNYHSSKPECFFELSRLFGSVRNQVERKRLLTCALKLGRERGSGCRVARILRHLADANGLMGLLKEGIQLVKEASEIGEQLGDRVVQGQCLIGLAWLLCEDEQLDTAEEAASHAIALFPENGEQHRLCGSHRILGDIYRSKGETEKAIHHSKVALRIAPSFDCHEEPFWVHYRLAGLFYDEGRFDDANTHIERAKSHAVNSTYNLGYAMEMQTKIWRKQHRLEEARSEVLRAADVYETLGAAKDVEDCGTLLRDIQNGLDTAAASGQSDFNCELL